MAKKESTFINMLVALLVITGVSSATLGFVYNVTKAPIEASKQKKLTAAISQVLPEFDKIEAKSYAPAVDGKDSLIFYTATKNNEIVGTAVKTYTDKGFSGRFSIMVGFRPDGKIHKTAVLAHTETPGLGDKMDASKSNFPNQFIDKNPAEFKLIVKKDGGDVDAITAATISSRAFCDAVNRAYETIKKEGGIK